MSSQTIRNRIAVIGGGGFRTPRLLSGLIRNASELGVDTIALYDPDASRVEIMAAIGRYLVSLNGVDNRCAVKLEVTDTPEAAARNADYVLFTFRPGGEDGRVNDERACLNLGVLGQETVGPGGFFAAIRAIPVVMEMVRTIRYVAPDAWILNFVNPVGVVSEAARSMGETRFIGVCDTPYHLVQELATYLRTETSRLRVEYVGLNHYGFVTRAWYGQQDRVPELLSGLANVVRTIRPLSFFSPEDIREIGAIPTEYVYFYRHAAEIADRIRAHGMIRSEDVRERSRRFFEEGLPLLMAGNDAALWNAYRTALVRRSNSYLQWETGAPLRRTLAENSIFETESYERVAIDAMLGLSGAGSRVAIINVPGAGILTPYVERQAIVEATCLIDDKGVVPLGLTTPCPVTVGPGIRVLKQYELATVAAAQSRKTGDLVEALAANPIVPSHDVARALLTERCRYGAT